VVTKRIENSKQEQENDRGEENCRLGEGKGWGVAGVVNVVVVEGW